MRYGRLLVTAMSPIRRGASKRVIWICRCDCGSEHAASSSDLVSGSTQSCGCTQHDGRARRTHGQSHTRAFNIWLSMKQRCENPKSHAFRLYGARGIKVCERWQSFGNFLADMGHPATDLTIDRIDNDLGYEPGNCRWADRTTQAKNTRRNILITWRGRTQNISDWARELRISNSTLCRRIRELGIPLAFEKPVRRRANGTFVFTQTA